MLGGPGIRERVLREQRMRQQSVAEEERRKQREQAMLQRLEEHRRRVLERNSQQVHETIDHGQDAVKAESTGRKVAAKDEACPASDSKPVGSHHLAGRLGDWEQSALVREGGRGPCDSQDHRGSRGLLVYDDLGESSCGLCDQGQSEQGGCGCLPFWLICTAVSPPVRFFCATTNGGDPAGEGTVADARWACSCERASATDSVR
jgi:hypothetical protein